MELMYLLWANDRGAWWRPGGWGYTTSRAAAGRFTEAEAVRYVVQSAMSGLVGEATVMVADTVED